RRCDANATHAPKTEKGIRGRGTSLRFGGRHSRHALGPLLADAAVLPRPFDFGFAFVSGPLLRRFAPCPPEPHWGSLGCPRPARGRPLRDGPRRLRVGRPQPPGRSIATIGPRGRW